MAGRPATVASVMRHLTQLRSDDPQLAHLAAAAVLVAKEGRSSASAGGWSTQDMEDQRAYVRRLERAWTAYLAGGPHDADRAAGSAALHLAFKEMEAAVRGGAPIPGRDELLVHVARSLLHHDFSSACEVEAHVTALLSEGGAGGRAAALPQEALLCLAGGGQAQRGVLAGGGCVSRAAALVGAMLGPPSVAPAAAVC